VVRVGERPPRDVRGVVPSEMRLVEQDAHQLRHGERGMGVVELNGGLFRQRVPVAVPLAEPANNVGDRAGDQEILLRQA
jgi:hypothetical protein